MKKRTLRRHLAEEFRADELRRVQGSMQEDYVPTYDLAGREID